MKVIYLIFNFLIISFYYSCQNNSKNKLKIELIKKIKNNQFNKDTFYLKNDKFNNLKFYNNLIEDDSCIFKETILIRKPEFYYLLLNEDLYYPIIIFNFKNLNEKHQLINCFKKKITRRGEHSINFIIDEDYKLKIIGFPNRISTKNPIYLDSAYFRKARSYVEIYN